VSAMMTFEQFVRPALRKVTGHRNLFRPTVQARVVDGLRKQPGRMHFVRVELERRDGEIFATVAGNQSSGALRSMTRAAGLLLFPADAVEVAQGSLATVQVLDSEFFTSSEPGY